MQSQHGDIVPGAYENRDAMLRTTIDQKKRKGHRGRPCGYTGPVLSAPAPPPHHTATCEAQLENSFGPQRV
jgi:hypothetical protein